MGRIKTILIKRTAKQLIKEEPESFTKEFEENKEVLKGIFPSKKMRNQIAGYITRLKKNEKKLLNNEEQ